MSRVDNDVPRRSAGTGARRLACAAGWLGVAVLACAAPALAAGPAGTVTGQLQLELENDLSHTPHASPANMNQLYLEAYPTVDLHLSDSLFIHSYGDFEVVKNPTSGFFHAFQGEGAYLEELSLNYATKNVGLFAGKFDPNIVSDFAWTPNLFATDLAQDDQEITERVGAGGYLPIATAHSGSHRLYVSVFRQDRSVLSESLFTNRGRNTLADGGPSNTSGLASVYLGALGGGKTRYGATSYNVDLVRQAVDVAGAGAGVPAATEYRVDLALQNVFALDKTSSITPMLYYTRMWNADGNRDEDRDYLTGSLTYGLGPWSLDAAYTGRLVSGNKSYNSNRQDIELSGTYTFASGIGVQLGTKLYTGSGYAGQTLFGLITKTLTF